MKIVITFLGLLFWLQSSFSQSTNFNLQPYTSQTNCLTVNGNSNTAGSVVLAPCTSGSQYQIFSIYNPTNVGAFPITPGSCAKECLDIAGPSSPVYVVQQPCNPGRFEQYWIRQEVAGANAGFTWLKNYKNGTCMTAEGGALGGLLGLGNYVDAYACTSQAHQYWQWTVNPAASGSDYSIQDQAYSTCLNVKSGNAADGTQMEVTACDGTKYSQHFEPGMTTFSMWKVSGSGLCLDGGSGAGNAYQYTCTPTANNQQWITVIYPYDTFRYFVDIMSGYCLTFNQATNYVGLQVCVKGNSNQQWLATAV